jgi:excisionase family DNA binding protein
VSTQRAYESSQTAPGGLLTVNEVSRLLNVSRWTTYRLVRDGQLRAVRVGQRLRFRMVDIDRYLERGEPVS